MSTDSAKGPKTAHFKLKSKTKFSELLNGNADVIPTSDLLLSDPEAVYQFEYVESEDGKEKVIVNPGIFSLTETSAGVRLEKTEIRTDNLLASVDNTKLIKDQIKNFFSKLHIYDKRGVVTKKRSILFFSQPGLGKSSSIRKTVLELCQEDPGTVVLIWPTSEISAEGVSRFFTHRSEYSDKCTRLVLIIEEIGGVSDDSPYARKDVSSGLLNFLDGINVTFRLPTFIVATTNFPQKLLKNLADRPGRFDRLIELPPPSKKEKIELMEFFEKRPLTEEEKSAFDLKGSENLSIAHLQEIGFRAELEDMTFKEVVKQMIAHTEKMKNDFEEPTKPMGLGNFWEE